MPFPFRSNSFAIVRRSPPGEPRRLISAARVNAELEMMASFNSYFLAVFTAEAVIKLLGLGPNLYFRSLRKSPQTDPNIPNLRNQTPSTHRDLNEMRW